MFSPAPFMPGAPERSTKLKSQAGLAAASKAIDLYNAGYRSQDRLLSALHEHHTH